MDKLAVHVCALLWDKKKKRKGIPNAETQTVMSVIKKN